MVHPAPHMSAQEAINTVDRLLKFEKNIVFHLQYEANIKDIVLVTVYATQLGNAKFKLMGDFRPRKTLPGFSVS